MNTKSDDSQADERVQISTRVLPDIRQKARIQAARCNLSVSQWINQLIEHAVLHQPQEDRHVS